MTIREQAIRLCEFAANGSGNSVLDQLVQAAEFLPEAGDLADEACNACCLSIDYMGFDWRELWAAAAQLLREGWEP